MYDFLKLLKSSSEFFTTRKGRFPMFELEVDRKASSSRGDE